MATLNKSIKLELEGHDGLHITICFLEEIPETKYNILKSWMANNFKVVDGKLPGKWTIKFLGKWGDNSDFVTGYDKCGQGLEYVRDEIFKFVNEHAGEYVSRKRYPSGMPPTHIEVKKLSTRPSGQQWDDISLILK